MSQNQYPCSACGANVEFAPGTDALKCPYCGAVTKLERSTTMLREHSWDDFVAKPRRPIALIGAKVFVCRGCGARTESTAIADRCQFCGAPVVADVSPEEQVVPEGVLPFGVDRAALRAALQKWVASRWFAPSGLKKVTEAESSRSTYLPHWT